MATAQRTRNKKTKVTPSAELERPPSAASHNSWVGDDLHGDTSAETEHVTTPVQHLTPSVGSVLSVREFDEDGNAHESRPVSPRSPSPRNLLDRPVTPNSGRISPLDGIMGKKKVKVVPTDEELPNVDPIGPVHPSASEHIEAWSDTSTPDLHDDIIPKGRPKTAVSTRTAPVRTRTPGEGVHSGSVPSMHSVISVKEAAEDHRIDGAAQGRVSPSRGPSTRARHDEDNRSLVSAGSHARITPPQLEHEQQAYVPFVYARDCIARVMEDMKKMKGNHVRIVYEIQDNYREIENQTQGQFNVFVIGLRKQYKDKVVTFRQVIDVHRKELDSHKLYWEQTLMSLNQRNKELMKEKKRLLIINKVEIERLEKEKEQLTGELTQNIDQEHHKFTSTKKELEEKLTATVDEKKILEDQLQSEKDQVCRLNEEIEALRSSPTSTTVATASVAPTSSSVERTSLERSSSETKPGLAVSAGVTGAVIAGGLGEEERKRLRDEKAEMQDKYVDSQKEYVVLQSRYAALEAQFQIVAKAAAESGGDKMDEQIGSLKNDQEMMKQEGDELTEEIHKWEEDFKEQNDRDPTEEERPMSVRELQTRLDEVNNLQANLESQVTTLTAIQEGNVPEPEPVNAPEPIVKTVEVTVPDPATVAALSVAQQRVAELNATIQSLRSMVDDNKTTIKSLEKENKKLSKKEKKVHVVTKDEKEERNLRLLLQAVISQVHGINENVVTAKEQAASRLEVAESEKATLREAQDQVRTEVDNWEEQYNSEHGEKPDQSEKDENASHLYTALNGTNQKVLANEMDVTALTMIQTGVVPDEFGGMAAAQIVVSGGSSGVSDVELDELKSRIEELEDENEGLTDKNSVLKDKNQELEESNEDLEEKIEELEARIKELEVSGGGVSVDSTAAALARLELDDDDMEGMSGQLTALQHKVDAAERQLQEEKDAHQKTKEELEALEEEIERFRVEKASDDAGSNARVTAATVALTAELALQTKNLAKAKRQIDALEQEKLKNVPVDTAKEITNINMKLKALEKEKEAAQKEAFAKTAEASKMGVDLASAQKALAKERETNRGNQETLKKKMAEKDKHTKEMVANTEKKYTDRMAENKKQIASLEKKVKELSAAGAVAGGAAAGKAAGSKGDAKAERKIQLLTEQNANLKKQVQDEQAKARQLEKDMKDAKAGGAADKQASKKSEKHIKDLEKKLEMETKKYEREQKKANNAETELKSTTMERDSMKDEVGKLTAQIASLGVAAQEALELKEKVTEMVKEDKELQKEVKALAENYNSERVLRKKYYNMVEDMKGKIRVYCRARPLSGSEKERGNVAIIKAPDEYSIEVAGSRGTKEFQFDHIFMPDSTQEMVFEDTDRLIQSAVDGYNVCIFAYGQTGSGKTFTMIGDRDQQLPGITPRAFKKIFELAEENRSKFSFRVYSYMLELYNEKLIDLYYREKGEPPRLDIKKDKKGMVFISGSVVQEASNSKELFGLFEEGSANRHVSSTKMNSESSRSHLVVGIIIESTSLSTGTVTKGKLSLVDLAGSERAAKTGASAEQLKEANSINKSLSALGDVISALSSEQSFIPYRNNKLTMLMQDSLGGNAKTLMFVNISPADYNAEETIISLTYASRVKLITNDASKNADNKEIARLKDVIGKLKKGETMDEEEVEA